MLPFGRLVQKDARLSPTKLTGACKGTESATHAPGAPPRSGTEEDGGKICGGEPDKKSVRRGRTTRQERGKLNPKP